MKRWIPVLLTFLLLLPAGLAGAEPESLREFDSTAQKERYWSLLEDLRCLVCQNESLAGSQADLAQDLRDEVYQKVVEEGKSNEAVIEYLVDRYGEFVLYQPPVQPSTYLLWFGPFTLLAVGAGIWLLVARRRARAGPAELSPEERARAAELLGTDSDKDSAQ
ncbi:cytochrome c-type biogenesis protein [Thiohalorhabdus methylotrophus]|uniref:Cytochrome c-type biogenesis protein n=1 Tax=Thiohalorhabdus methylotrophus TaxID=3242694 RepID=A0ABV4TS12_9GAMM